MGKEKIVSCEKTIFLVLHDLGVCGMIGRVFAPNLKVPAWYANAKNQKVGKVSPIMKDPKIFKISRKMNNVERIKSQAMLGSFL